MVGRRMHLGFALPLRAVADAQRYPSRSTSEFLMLNWWVVQDSNLRPID